MNNSTLGVAVWGIGEHAQRNILPAINQSGKVRLVGVSTRNKKTLADISNQYGCQVWDDPQSMLCDESVDVVYISSPVGLHFEHSVRVLRAGKHLWCEKLLTPDLEQTLELVSLSELYDLALCEAVMYQFHPQFVKLKHLLEEPVIGKVKSVVAQFGFPHLPADNFRYQPELGGGALLDAAVYPLSAALLLDSGRPEVVYSSISSDDGYAIDTQGSAHLVMTSGTEYMAEWCFGCSYRNQMDFWGQLGYISAQRAFSKPPSYEASVMVSHVDGTETEIKVLPTNHFIEMVDSFSLTVSDQKLKAGNRKFSSDLAWLINEVRLKSKSK